MIMNFRKAVRELITHKINLQQAPGTSEKSNVQDAFPNQKFVNSESNGFKIYNPYRTRWVVS